MKYFEEWLLKARHDLMTAKVIFEANSELWDTAVYHTQQSAEKSLKAISAFHKEPINKTHNVRLLLEDCVDRYPQLMELTQPVFYVAPFDTMFRYPSMELSPDKSTITKAIESAEIIYSTVQSLLIVEQNNNQNKD